MRLHCCVAAALLSIALVQTAAAQSLPPVAATTERTKHRVDAQGKALPAVEPATGFLATHPWFLPLAAAGKKADDPAKFILAFYGRDSAFAPADQVQFLYGFGGEQRKALSADLMALIFPGGWRLGLGSSVGSGGSAGATQTPAEAVERLREGGDMYLTLAYPLLAGTKDRFTGSLFFEPRVNFLLNGFAGTDTVSEATESTRNIGVSGSLELKDLQGLGAVFVYTRLGRQHVSSAFQTAAKLASQDFGVFEVAIGAQFGSFLRVSAQRFQAPAGAAGVSFEKLRGWHLVVQLAPRVKK